MNYHDALKKIKVLDIAKQQGIISEAFFKRESDTLRAYVDKVSKQKAEDDVATKNLMTGINTKYKTV
ncbi:hypothetical protein DH09_02415 [Bacillaceae bacterium JMAK1]|nr:hypothetical protein DH09_02415 [Bacillaceae bacterium JMAK1]